MPYDCFEHMHLRQLRQCLVGHSELMNPTANPQEELKESEKLASALPQAPITQAMVREFDNQSLTLGSVHSDLGKRRYD